MRKLLFAVGVMFLFLGCEVNSYSVVITNDSSKTVSYTYDGHFETLAPSESKTYEVEAYTQAPKSIADQNGIMSIVIDRNGDNFSFIDATPFNLSVINMLPINITIKADNFIDSNGSMELLIENGDEATALIYTNKPNFTAISNYPVIFEWNIKNNEISVIIR